MPCWPVGWPVDWPVGWLIVVTSLSCYRQDSSIQKDRQARAMWQKVKTGLALISLWLASWIMGLAAVMPVSTAQAQMTDHAAVIMYHRFGEPRYPSTNIPVEQFEAHLKFLAEGGYSVLPLGDIVTRLQSGDGVPDRTVAITIDDAYLSVYEHAWPLLEKYGFALTLFVATDAIDRGLRGYMSWDQLREMQAAGVTIGSQTKTHPHMHRLDPDQITAELEESAERFLAELGLRPDLFAYPFGEYSAIVIEAVKAAGFRAAFGQNSGIMHSDDLFFELPRFAFNETYSSLDRLKLAADGQPLKVTDITPSDMVLTQNPPLYGFTLTAEMLPASQLRCFASQYGQIDVSLLGPRAEVRLPGPMDGPRFRINCTLPGDDGRWRWFGRQFLTE